MKIIIWKKKAAALLAAALAVCMGGYALFYPTEAHAAERQLPIYSVDKGQQKICSISFDAAWENANLRRASSPALRLRPQPPTFPPSSPDSSRGRSSPEKR